MRNYEVSWHQAGAGNDRSQKIVASLFIRRPDAICVEELSQSNVLVKDDDTLGGVQERKREAVY